jgi:hypothetical protein
MPPPAPSPSAWPPDTTKLVVFYLQLWHRLLRRTTCACWICAQASRVGQEVQKQQGLQMATALREDAHDEAHDRINTLMRRRPRPTQVPHGGFRHRPSRARTPERV